jgi:hypothetical protein
VPAYVHVTFAVAALGLLTAVVAPAPKMPLPRAARMCRLLMGIGGLVLIIALSMPMFDVWYPALAGCALAAFVWLTMFWLARQPDIFAVPAEAAEDHDDPGEDDGGGGGGGSPSTDPPPGPPSPHGVDWDAFDRQRQAWEPARTPIGV